MIKITAVNYLNTKPLLAGIQYLNISHPFQLELKMPSLCAQAALNNSTDIALIPAATLPLLKNYDVITDFCIGSVGQVGTVAIYSHVDINQISEIILDSHSRTSVLLCQYLMEKFWQKKVKYTIGVDGFENRLEKNSAGLVIGDKTIPIEQKYAYKYDLGKAWTTFTRMPFVYAVWVAKKGLDVLCIKLLNDLIQLGIKMTHENLNIIHNPFSSFDLENYYKNCISFEFDVAKKEALSLFLNIIEKNEYK